MANSLEIYSCHLCKDSQSLDLPALTEHLASVHMDGFYTLRCPRCDTKFTTFHMAAHHLDLDLCNAPEINEWVVSNRASIFEKHEHLNNLVNEAITFSLVGDGPRVSSTPNEHSPTTVCPRSESESAPLPLTSPDTAAVESGEEEKVGVDDEERPASAASAVSMDIELSDDEEEPGKEIVAEPSVSVNMRKRRHDGTDETKEAKPTIENVLSSGYNTPFSSYGGFPLGIQIPVTPQPYDKNVDLMSLPQIGASATHQGPISMTMTNPTTSGWYFSPPGPSVPTSANTHNKARSQSKLHGPMPLMNLCKFTEKSSENDVIVEVGGSKGIHTMYFPEELLKYCSPFFKHLLLSPDFQVKKKITLSCALPSFLDCMNVIYGKPLPWLFTCEEFFKITNLHRIERLLRTADGLQLEYVRTFVAKQLFASRCGILSANPNLCECVGCIERVALALYFGIDIPPGLTFSPTASLTWLRHCGEYSCAPELKVVEAVGRYLNITQAI